MASFQLYTGNRLEKLVEILAETIRRPLSSPFQPEVIVVQSSGMARWVSMAVARRLGICANTRFYYPNEFVSEILGGVLGQGSAGDWFEPEIMTFRIMRLLPDLLTEPGFESLGRYLGGDRAPVKLLQLSGRIADLFDQYTLFRPEMIFLWEAGREDHWQAVLWRALARQAQGLHRPAMLKKVQEVIGSGSCPCGQIPARISVFGISALPRFHVDVLAAVARTAEVNLFVMNPCAEYWGDLPSPGEVKRAAARALRENIPRELLYLDQGNSLLAGLGTLGRDFMELLQAHEIEQQAFFQEPGEDSLLHCIQSDILYLRPPAADPAQAKREIRAGDDSIRVHACHSPMREIEVLYDHLLDWFQQDPDLVPGDILVMMPDIETYAPYIQAVLDTPEEERRRIPYSIADRSLQAESALINTFMDLLDLLKSRFTLGEVMAVLECEAVRNCFDLDERDYNLILKWVRETNIRWGLNGRHRAALGLPATMENTWQAGLERMLLGYAMAGEGRHLFAGRLPYDPLEGEAALALGKLAEFMAVLARTAQNFSHSKTLAQWSAALADLLDAVFRSADEGESGIQSLREQVLALEELARLSGFDQSVPLEVIQQHLLEQFGKKGFGFGFITGGVTFCAMVPMRSIPFKIICLLGMDHNAYPRENRRISFDLMAAAPKPGDRSRRHDDQYLFLEALVSARQRLYISHVGQSIQDNSLSPPSVLVSALMDYIRLGFYRPDDAQLEQIHIHQRLQPFSPAYFSDPWEQSGNSQARRLFSYSLENKTAAATLLSQRKARRPFLTHELPPAGENFRSITLAELCRFFVNPARYWMQERLGIVLEVGEEVLEEREPFAIQGLSRYLMEQEMLAAALGGGSAMEIKAVKRAAGELPHGTVGECRFEKLAGAADEFAQKVLNFTDGAILPRLPVDLDLAGFRLTGQLDDIFGRYLLRCRYARIKPGDILSAWISHLILNLLRPQDYPHTTMLLGLKGTSRSQSRPWTWTFSEVADSRGLLQSLLTIYWEGLRRPLPFFPLAAMAYMEAVMDQKKNQAQALDRAQAAWEGGEYKTGEKNEPYFQRCFGDQVVLDEAFTHLTHKILQPLYAHLTEKPCDEEF